MKKRIVHLVCNAHLDPVWMWRWEDGLAEALSTFRVAAEFCERHREFVFNHNESLLYEWIETHDPALFARIRRLVRRGQWHIAGGAYLQPDLNAPCGESHIRHYLYGKRYFARTFGSVPTTAYNFDSFGQPEGLPQILSGCGCDSYVFCRPSHGTRKLPAGAFSWQDRSGATVTARRSDDHYLTNGAIYAALQKWLKHYEREPQTMILWGIGDHGGGASRKEYAELRRFVRDHPQYDIRHSTPERFFAAVRRQPRALPVMRGEFQDCLPGCYTTVSRLKRAHRAAEALVQSVERMAALAWWEFGRRYPQEQLTEAWKDVLFAEFHDILPGSCIEPAVRDALVRLGRGEEELRRVRSGLFVDLARRSRPARNGEVPLFVWNPHGFRVQSVVECEYSIAGIARAHGSSRIVVRDETGRTVPCQREKEEANLACDWMIRLALPVTLEPFALRRYNASFEPLQPPRRPTVRPVPRRGLLLESSAYRVRINGRTGLVDLFQPRRGHTSLVRKGAFRPVVFADISHSWECGTPPPTRRKSSGDMWSFAHQWRSPPEAFRLAGPARARTVLNSPPGTPRVDALHVVEDGPVRTVVEAVFVWKQSHIVRRYIFGTSPACFEIQDRIMWNAADSLLKLEVPLNMHARGTLSETPYSAVFRAARNDRHEEQSNQQWVAALGTGGTYLAAVNDGSYAHSLYANTLYLNVLRSPAFSSARLSPACESHAKRFVPRQEQGEHTVRFGFACGSRFSEAKVHRYAAAFNMPPQVFVHYAGGSGTARRGPRSSVRVTPDNVEIVAVKRAESGRGLIVRLRELAGRRTRFSCRLARGASFRGSIGPYGLETVLVGRQRAGRGAARRVNLIER
jgi:alpha-mannosidase